jgi:peptidase M28-like protein
MSRSGLLGGPPRAGLLAGALALGVLLPVGPLGCQAGPDTASLMHEVRVLAADSMEGRKAGTPGGARARRYLVQRLRALKLAPLGKDLEQPFDGGINLLAVIPGTGLSGRYIVLSAHYDHLGTVRGQVYNGADDNASGTAAVLAIAAELRRKPLTHSVIVALFDAEEAGLLGARAFVATRPVAPSTIALDVNLDMVGHSERGELWAAGTARYPALLPALTAVRERAPIRLLLGHDRSGVRGQQDWSLDSDHGAFHEAGIPFIYFGVEDHKDYHRPTDDPETLTPAFFAGAVRTVLDAVRTLDSAIR